MGGLGAAHNKTIKLVALEIPPHLLRPPIQMPFKVLMVAIPLVVQIVAVVAVEEQGRLEQVLQIPLKLQEKVEMVLHRQYQAHL
jgi:hypothetical protein